MLTRREWLKQSSLLALAPTLPGIFANTARAVASTADAKVLVVVQLDGGNDGLNTLVPYTDDHYARARKSLRLPVGELHKLDDRIALHPNMRASKQLFDDGRLCIVQGVGYPNPSRSHFRSMEIWQSAQTDEEVNGGYGWLGSALDDSLPSEATSGGPQAIYVGEAETPMAVWGRRTSTATLARSDDLKLELAVNTSSAAASVPEGEATISQFVTHEVQAAYAAAEDFQRRTSQAAGGAGSYPDTQLATNLKLIAQLLKSQAKTRVFYTVQTGYDTHASQRFIHGQLLRDFSAASLSFLDDLKQAGLDDRVVLLAFSEFGRRVEENDSHGTDHGTAGPVFLAGSPVRAGLVGAAPDLADLDAGDLKAQFDFRQIYASLLEDWLAVPSQKILGQPFKKLPILT